MGNGVTDEGLRLLAQGGCGPNLTSLALSCACTLPFRAFIIFAPPFPCLARVYVLCMRFACVRLCLCACVLVLVFCVCVVQYECARVFSLKGSRKTALAKVTDQGLRALAQGGCGPKMKVLSLHSECNPLLFVCHHLRSSCFSLFFLTLILIHVPFSPALLLSPPAWLVSLLLMIKHPIQRTRQCFQR